MMKQDDERNELPAGAEFVFGLRRMFTRKSETIFGVSGTHPKF